MDFAKPGFPRPFRQKQIPSIHCSTLLAKMNRNLSPSASLVLVLLFGAFLAKNVSAELVFSHQRGFYDTPFDLVIETDHGR